MLEREITTKELKILHELNQVVKNVFLHYAVLPDGTILGLPDDFTLENGRHVAIMKNIESLMNILPIKSSIKIDSRALFETHRDNKKDLKRIVVDGDDIYLAGDERYKIGSMFIDVDSDEYKKMYDETWNTMRNGKFKELEPDTAEKLMSLDAFMLQEDNLRVKIVKGLIPNLTKTSTVYVCFEDHGEDSLLFDVVLNIEKNNVSTYHRYTCIKY